MADMWYELNSDEKELVIVCIYEVQVFLLF